MATTGYLQNMTGTKIKAHWLGELKKEYKDYLIKILDTNIHITFGDTDNYNYSVLIAGRPESKDLEKENLEALIVPFVGIPQKTSVLMLSFPHINIHNTHFNDTITAEMAITLMLASAKRIVSIDKIFRQHNWQQRMVNSLYLANKNVLILGYGAIGKKIAQMCKAFSMNIFAIRKSCNDEYMDNDIKVLPITTLDSILPSIHVLMISLPETNETRCLINEKRLGLLKEGAIIVNIGRAAVVEEKALYFALKDKNLFAGFDVWYNYPDDNNTNNCPPSNYPFHELPNVVMSPHRASRSEELEYLRVEHVAMLLNQKSKGKTMDNKINLTKGY